MSEQSADETECLVCGEGLPNEYDKWDDDAPVYADTYVVHKRCETEIFNWQVEKGDTDE